MRKFVYLAIGILAFACTQKKVEEPVVEVAEPKSPDIHEATGLIKAEGMELVIANCTACHSAALITQNRASRAGWEGTIRWMQETQKLWDLGANEQAILDYLEKNYAPEETGRRKPLTDVEWYELNE